MADAPPTEYAIACGRPDAEGNENAMPPADNVSTQGTEAALSIETALMIPTVAAIMVDGEIDDGEIAQLMALCLHSPIFVDNSEQQDAEIIMDATRLVQMFGARTMCCRAASALTPALRETAYAFAVAIVGSDGHVAVSEESLISSLVGWLSLDRGRAHQIASIIPVLQNGRNS